jgi:hypothetical protein
MREPNVGTQTRTRTGAVGQLSHGARAGIAALAIR